MTNGELAVVLRGMKHTLSEIATALGISKSRASQLLRERGLKGRLNQQPPAALTHELTFGPFITRAEAMRRGLNKYFSGKPCAAGHVDVCYVKGGCITCSYQRAAAKRAKAIGSRIRPAVGVYGPYISRAQAQEKNINRFYNGVPCRHGHVALRQTSDGNCVECARISSLRSSRKPENRARSLVRAAAFRTENRIRLRAEARRRGRLRNHSKIFQELSKEARFSKRIRSLLYNALNRQKSATTEKLLSCSIEKAKAYLESLFEPGMTFDTNKRAEWHIDHVRPCSSFDDLENNPEQQRACCFFANLQPLWAKDNLTKRAAWTREMEADWIVLMRSHGFTGDLFPVFDHELVAA